MLLVSILLVLQALWMPLHRSEFSHAAALPCSRHNRTGNI